MNLRWFFSSTHQLRVSVIASVRCSPQTASYVSALNAMRIDSNHALFQCWPSIYGSFVCNDRAETAFHWPEFYKLVQDLRTINGHLGGDFQWVENHHNLWCKRNIPKHRNAFISNFQFGNPKMSSIFPFLPATCFWTLYKELEYHSTQHEFHLSLGVLTCQLCLTLTTKLDKRFSGFIKSLPKKSSLYTTVLFWGSDHKSAVPFILRLLPFHNTLLHPLSGWLW